MPQRWRHELASTQAAGLTQLRSLWLSIAPRQVASWSRASAGRRWPPSATSTPTTSWPSSAPERRTLLEEHRDRVRAHVAGLTACLLVLDTKIDGYAATEPRGETDE